MSRRARQTYIYRSHHHTILILLYGDLSLIIKVVQQPINIIVK